MAIASVAVCALGIAADVDISTTSLSVHMTEAHAVVGRPLTPVSYAGVARRTSRRTVARTTGAYGYGYGYGAGAVAGAAAVATITALPAGCTTLAGAPRYQCGDVIYRPVYDGPDVVYVIDD